MFQNTGRESNNTRSYGIEIITEVSEHRKQLTAVGCSDVEQLFCRMLKLKQRSSVETAPHSGNDAVSVSTGSLDIVRFAGVVSSQHRITSRHHLPAIIDWKDS